MGSRARPGAADTPDARLGYPDPRGEPELREALAASLARRRGVQASADEVAGHRRPRARACRSCGGCSPPAASRRVAIEDPCWPRLAPTLARGRPGAGPDAGRRATACAPHALGADVGAVFVTPAHQYPTGAVLSPARRAALIEWARDRGAFVVEDDYDAEFRYDRQPVGSLQGLAPDVVIYGGSTLQDARARPAARLARAAAKGDRAPTRPRRRRSLDQLALADLIARGDFDRHLRHHRRLYRRRREALLDALAARLPGHAISGAAAGLHAVLHVTHRRRRGAPPRRPSAASRSMRSTAARLVVGYANLPESQAPAAVEALAQALQTDEGPAGESGAFRVQAVSVASAVTTAWSGQGWGETAARGRRGGDTRGERRRRSLAYDGLNGHVCVVVSGRSVRQVELFHSPAPRSWGAGWRLRTTGTARP